VLGPILRDNQEEVLLGHQGGRTQNVPRTPPARIAAEVRGLVHGWPDEARRILTERLDDCTALAKAP